MKINHHALWLIALSFIHGILSPEVDKPLVVTLLQESCGLLNGTATVT